MPPECTEALVMPLCRLACSLRRRAGWRASPCGSQSVQLPVCKRLSTNVKCRPQAGRMMSHAALQSLPPHSPPLSVSTIRGQAEPCKKTSAVWRTTAERRRPATLRRWAAQLPMVLVRLRQPSACPRNPVATHRDRAPFRISQEPGVRLDLDARSTPTMQWSVERVAGKSPPSLPSSCRHSTCIAQSQTIRPRLPPGEFYIETASRARSDHMSHVTCPQEPGVRLDLDARSTPTMQWSVERVAGKSPPSLPSSCRHSTCIAQSQTIRPRLPPGEFYIETASRARSDHMSHVTCRAHIVVDHDRLRYFLGAAGHLNPYSIAVRDQTV